MSLTLALIFSIIYSIDWNRFDQGPGRTIQVAESVVVALENGPLVVAVTLTNTGDSTSTFWSYQYDNYGIFLPKNWERKLVITDIIGKSDGPSIIEILPGKSVTKIFPVHRGAIIPSGQSAITINVALREYDRTFDPEKFLRTVVRNEGGTSITGTTYTYRPPVQLYRSLRIDLDISKFDPAQLAASIKADRFLPTPVAKTDPNVLEAIILDTEIPEFLPLAVHLSKRSRQHRRQMVYWMFRLPSTVPVVSEVIQMATAQDSAFPLLLISESRNCLRQHPVKQEQFKQLVSCPNIWARVAAYLCFPEAFSKLDMTALMRDLSVVTKPISDKNLNAIVLNLDDNAYRTREASGNAILQLGDGVIPMLKARVKTARSLETEVRLTAILESLERQPPAPAEAEFFEASTRYMKENPRVRSVLEALARNDLDARVTRTARACLAELNKVPPKK